MKKVFAAGIDGEMNITVAFRRKIAACKQPFLKIAASNVFRIFIDGQLTGYGPRRSAHGISVLNEYSLSGFENKDFCITVEVAQYGCGGFYTVKEPPFFACELYDGGALVCDAGDFTAYLMSDRLQKVQRYSYQRTFTESYIMQEDRIGFYLGGSCGFKQMSLAEVAGNRIIEAGLPYPSFNKIIIDAVAESGTVFEREKPFIYKNRSISEISDKYPGFKPEELESFLSREAGRIGFKKTEESIHGNRIRDGYRLLDLGRNYTSFIGAQIDAEEDSEVYFIFDEILCEELQKKGEEPWLDEGVLPLAFHRLQCCNVIKYKLFAGSSYSLLSFEPYTLRWLKIIVKGAAVLRELYHTPLENSAADETRFRMSDETPNSIFCAAVNTFKQNSVDVLTDCPSRERAGWLCDSYFIGRAEQLLTGGNAVERNMLYAYLMSPESEYLPEGMLPMCYPADHFDGVYIPNWAMFYVIELEDYFLRTRERELINKNKTKVFKLISFLEGYKNSTGLLEKLDSWVFVEWSKAAEFVQDVNFPSNMLYYKMLISAYNLYGEEKFAVRAGEVKRAICGLSFNGEFFEDNAVYENGELTLKGNITETCQYYAFFSGIADKLSYPALYKKMFTEFGPRRNADKVYPNVYKSNAFIGNFLRLDYLKSEGRAEQVYNECIDYFGYMARRTGTLWENDKPHASCNHGFASYVAAFILEAVAGYKGFDPVAKKIFLTEPAVKADFCAELPVSGGVLKISSEKGRLSVKLPEGFTAE